MKKKLKFGGVSYGGFYGGGTIIYSKKYKLNIFKDFKTKEWKKVINKKKLPITIPLPILVFPIFDGMYFTLLFFPRLFLEGFKAIDSGVAWILSFLPKSSGTGTTISTNPIYTQIILYGVIIGLIIFVYFFVFRGVAYWHGCEHKVIAAGRNNDLKNVRKYNTIDDRCGGTFMLTMWGAMIFYWFLFFYIFNWFVPFGIFTFILFIMVIESKWFHSYNKLGIWFGRKLQKKLTVKEPHDWQLKLGVEGMTKLIDCEVNGK